MREPPLLQRRKRDWVSRNWKWFVPCLCLGALTVFVSFFLAIFFLVTGVIRNTGAYTEAVAIAKNDPRVIDALGSPLKEGIWSSGSVQIRGSSGDADLEIYLHGPKGKGTLYVIATRSAGAWQFSNLVFETSSSSRIDLKEKVNQR
jgi:hypothetical protein